MSEKVLLVDEAAIGIAIASYSFVQFLFNPIAGKLSDRFGRRPIIIISLLILQTQVTQGEEVLVFMMKVLL